MAHNWFRRETIQRDGLTEQDAVVLNQATRRLVDRYNLAPTRPALRLIRQSYRPGMSAHELVAAVNRQRETTIT